MKNRQVLFNMFASILQVVISTLITLLLTPHITETLGIEAYGFVQLSNTFITYLDIISVALNSFAARYISLEYYKGNIEKAEIYFNSTILANLILSLLLIVPIGIGIINLDSFIKIPSSLTMDVKILFMLTFMNYLLIINRTAFNVVTFIKNRLDLSYLANSICLLLKVGLLIFFFSLFFPKVYYVGAATVISSLVLFVLHITLKKMLLKDIHINIFKSNFKAIMNLLVSGMWSSINNLGNVLNSGLDLIITNQFLSSIAMGQLSIAQKLVSLISVLISQINTVFQPVQMRFYANKDMPSLINSLNFSMKITGLICEIVISSFVAIGLDFLNLWIPTQQYELIFIVTVLCMLGNVVVGCVSPLYYTYTLTDNLKLPSFVTIINGIFNILAMLILLNTTNLGIYGVVITTIICNFLVNFVWTPIYSAKCIGVKISTFYKEVINHVLLTMFSVLIAYLYNLFCFHANGWGMLIIKALSFMIIIVTILFLLKFNKEEKLNLIKIIKK